MTSAIASNVPASAPARRAAAVKSAPKAEILEKVREDGLLFKFAPQFRGDRAVVLAAVVQNGFALQYSSLKADKEVVLKAVASKGLALQFAHPSLREDREVVDVAVANDPDAVQFDALPSQTKFPRLEEAKRMVCRNRECTNFGGIEYAIDRCSNCDRQMEKM